MSPEQAEGRPVDHRSDLFSLGSVLYAMCTGRPPFRAGTSMGVLKRVCEGMPTPVREANPEVPDWLAAVVERLHAKEPAARFQSAAEVAELLGRHLAHVQHPSLVPLPIVARQSGKSDPAVPATTPGARPPVRHRWAAAAAVLVATLALLGTTEATGVTNVRATVIRIFTPEGTLVVETDDPAVKVTVEGDGDLVITGAGPQEVRLRAGSYRLKATKDGKPVKLDRDLVAISRGDRQIVHVRLEGAPGAEAKPNDWPVGEVRRHEWGAFRKCYFACFSPDGRFYTATGVSKEEPLSPDTLRVWETATGKLYMEVQGGLWAVFTPDSKRLIASGPDVRIHVWELETRTEVAKFGDFSDVTYPGLLSADGQQLLVADIHGKIHLFDVAGGKEVAQLECEGKQCTPCFCPDGKRAVTSGLDGTIRLWNLEQRKVIRRWEQTDVPPNYEPFYLPLTFTRDGNRFITVCNRSVHFWDPESETKVQSLQLAGRVFSAALSADGSRLLYLVDGDTTVRLVELPGGRELATFEAVDAQMARPHGRMGFSTDGRFAVAACWSGLIHVWRLPDLPAPTNK